MAPVIAARVGYVGELGWELYIPVDYAAYVFEQLTEAGPHRPRPCGLPRHRELPSGERYLYWSSDISPDTNPIEAGLGFAIAWDKGDFTGRPRWRRSASTGRSVSSLPSRFRASRPSSAVKPCCIGASPWPPSPARATVITWAAALVSPISRRRLRRRRNSRSRPSGLPTPQRAGPAASMMRRWKGSRHER